MLHALCSKMCNEEAVSAVMGFALNSRAYNTAQASCREVQTIALVTYHTLATCTSIGFWNAKCCPCLLLQLCSNASEAQHLKQHCWHSQFANLLGDLSRMPDAPLTKGTPEPVRLGLNGRSLALRLISGEKVTDERRPRGGDPTLLAGGSDHRSGLLLLERVLEGLAATEVPLINGPVTEPLCLSAVGSRLG